MKAQAIGTKAPDALRAYVRNLVEGLKALVREAAAKIVRLAQSRVGVDFSDLRATIRADLAESANEIVAEISAGRGLPEPDLAAWHEWGTGRFTEVQEGLSEYAMSFFRTGEGRTRPHPYFFSSVFEVKKQFMRDVLTLAKTGKVPS